MYPRMKELRKEHKLTQADAAKLVGVSTNHYGKYERGETDIPVMVLVELCAYYKVSLDYIVGWSNYRIESDSFKETCCETDEISALRNLRRKLL